MHNVKDYSKDFAIPMPMLTILRCSMQPPSGGELLLLRPTLTEGAGDDITPRDHEHCQGRSALGRSHLLNFALRDDLSDQLEQAPRQGV